MSKQIEVQMRHDHHYVSKLHKKTRKYDDGDGRKQGKTGTTYCTDNAWEGSKENKELLLRMV